MALIDLFISLWYYQYTLGGFKKEEPAFDDSASTTSSVSSSQTALQYHTTNTFQSSSSSGLLRGMGNALKNVINTHTRPKTPNEDLNKIEESIAIYEQTLASLEKEVSRMIKDYRGMFVLFLPVLLRELTLLSRFEYAIFFYGW